MLILLKYLVVIIIAQYVVQHFIYYLIFLSSQKKNSPRYDKKISLLIAVRNEEKNIYECLKSISEMNYPKELLQVHIGDDSSTDSTAEIVKKIISDKPNFHYHFIDKKYPDIQGKQNVLAHLFHLSENDGSEIVLITDADIRVKKEWVSQMAAGFEKENTGMISAPTYVKPSGLFSILQSLEWLYFTFTDKALSDLGKGISAIGNNMGVLRKAYNETGGYENISFSITEDYRLFEHVVLRRKWKFSFLFSDDVLNETNPADSVHHYFRQRKRWLAGGSEIPFVVKILLTANVLIIPALLISFFIFPVGLCLKFLLIKVLADFASTFIFLSALKKMKLLIYFLLFEIYYPFVIAVVPIYSLFPTKIVWKERKY